MNSKKGFTLVELLGVIVVLSVIAVIITPIITGVLKQQRESLYNSQIKLVIDAARNYVMDNSDTLNINEYGITILTSDLYDKGYINRDVKDPRNGQAFDACVKVSWDYENEQNVYEYEDRCIIEN